MSEKKDIGVWNFTVGQTGDERPAWSRVEVEVRGLSGNLELLEALFAWLLTPPGDSRT